MVLIGDALHTSHFSIGSGTRLALEDAIALAEAVRCNADVPGALQAYEQSRRPILEKLVKAADASGEWYERFAEHMQLAPLEFAMSYITRSGRFDDKKLSKIAPLFATAYRQHGGVLANSHIDGEGADASNSPEIIEQIHK